MPFLTPEQLQADHDAYRLARLKELEKSREEFRVKCAKLERLEKENPQLYLQEIAEIQERRRLRRENLHNNREDWLKFKRDVLKLSDIEVNRCTKQ